MDAPSLQRVSPAAPSGGADSAPSVSNRRAAGLAGWWPLARRNRGTLPRLNLALQGGGAHGAFTWGVLDALLEDPRLRFEGLSGSSAGAMNAVVLAHGWATGGRDGARQALADFWTAIGRQIPFGMVVHGSGEAISLSVASKLLAGWAGCFTPAQLNPLDLNPLRDVLAKQIDFERLRRDSPFKLFIGATNANTGKLRVFRDHELGIEVLLASACLPKIHAAVQIDAEAYWDGGYSANPALFPLVRCGVPDLLIVSLATMVHAAAPVSADDIRARALEFAFNAGFQREARLLGEAAAEARASWWPGGALERRLRRLRTHLIDADDALAALPGETRLIAHLPFLEHLRDLGRERAQRWLDDAGRAVGHTSSVDLARLYAPPGSHPAAA